MTAISSSLSMGGQMMATRIAKAASSGSISSTDQTALDTALDNIDGSLASSTNADATTGADMSSKVDSLIQQQVSAGTLTSDQAAELQSLFAPGQQSAGAAPAATPSTGTDATQALTGTQAPHGVHGHHHGGGKGGALAFLDSTSDTTDTTDTSDTTDPDTISGLTALADTGDTGITLPSADLGADAIGTVSGSSSSASSDATSLDQKQLDALSTFLQNLRSSLPSATYGPGGGDASGNSGLLVNMSA